MNEIAKILARYEHHLRDGGKRVNLPSLADKMGITGPTISPSQLVLCNRKATYRQLEKEGKIAATPTPDSLLVDFRMGNIMEEWVAEALEFEGRLVDYQHELWDEELRIHGFLDMIARLDSIRLPKYQISFVEMKTVKSKDPSILLKFNPKISHIAQLATYIDMSQLKNPDVRVMPVLFVALRTTFASQMYTWEWTSDGDARVYRNDDKEGWMPHKLIEHAREQIDASIQTQFTAIKTNFHALPGRCGSFPDEHPFLCVRNDWRAKMAYPSCGYYEECWDIPAEPFTKGLHGGK